MGSRHNYDAYGVALDAHLDAETIAGDVGPNLLYCGEQYDSTLNMYNLRARFYDPSNGRFNARDSFMGNNEDPQSLHKYAYCHADPCNGLDPSGRYTLTQTATANAIRGIIAAFALAAIVTGGFRVRGFNDTMAAQVEYRELATRLQAEYGSEVKVLDSAYLNELEKGIGFPPIPGSGEDDSESNYHFLHGGSTIDWIRQVRIKPIGRGDFGKGFYTFGASISGFLWSARWAIERTEDWGGYPFVMVLRISESDYNSVMSDALDLRNNESAWRDAVIDLFDTGTSSHPVVIGPMATGNRRKSPQVLEGPDQFKWESQGGGIKKLKPIFIVPVFKVGYSGKN